MANLMHFISLDIRNLKLFKLTSVQDSDHLTLFINIFNSHSIYIIPIIFRAYKLTKIFGLLLEYSP